MRDELSLLYRGPLPSCNFGCDYCPFAKRPAGARALEADRAALARFVAWVRDRSGPRSLSVFFVPAGEPLIHRHYQEALVELSRLPRLRRVAIQTNLSAELDGWLERVQAARLGVWASYHPGWITRADFLARCAALRARGASLSVGMVGRRELLGELAVMRRALDDEIYLWVNAFKRERGHLDEREVARVLEIDPLFRWSLEPQPSRGRRCLAGESVLFVDGAGTLRRCPFVPEPLGNLYARGATALEGVLAPRPCPLESCRCHIGYVHLEPRGLDGAFEEGILERVPVRRLWR
jgi:hypothetical protein